MLVLTRRVGESISLGRDIQVQIVALKGGQVRLAITAPCDISIQRSELLSSLTAPLGLETATSPVSGTG